MTVRPLVLAQSNDAQQNELLAFRRDPRDGSLSAVGAFTTKGTGSGAPHLPSQGSVTLAGNGRHAFVTNAGSGDVSVFDVTADEGPALVQVLPAGAAPRSAAEHAGLVYVLNTGDPSLMAFRLEGDGYVAVPDSRRELPADADAAQVGFSPDGARLVVTQRGRDAILTFPVGASGLLGDAAETTSSGPTPYGFTFTPAGVLVVTEAFGARRGEAAASSYVLDGGVVRPVSGSVHNGRSEICWAVATPTGGHVFTTNFADGAVSHWTVGPDGTLALVAAVAGVSVDGRPGLRDAALSPDGRFLYALDADAGLVVGWSVGADGRLTALGSRAPLPATVAGLAAS
jgi:6-phosphogluconolactonase